MAEGARVPRLVKADGADLRSLPLGPLEGFLLTRIDGKLDERDLAALTGLSAEQVKAGVDRLEELHVVSTGTGKTPPPAPPTSSHPPVGGPKASAPPAPEPSVSIDVRARTSEVKDDDPDLVEEVDLETDLRKRILGLHRRLPVLDFYEVLGIGRSTDKKTVKRAYFEIAAVFHPDKYFRKELGSFKLKMEAIFGRVTQAYDTLTSKQGRAEYDQYLVDLDRTRGIDAMLKDALAELQRAEADALSGVSATGASNAPPPVVDDIALGPGGHPSRPPPGGGVQNPRIAQQSAATTERLRRDAFARRLMAGRAPSSAIKTPVGSKGTGEAVQALKRRYEDRVSTARQTQIDKYVHMANESEAKNDVVAAANALRVALTFGSHDAALKARSDELSARADAVLAETYERQAVYEERSENWGEAARSWAKVAKARPESAKAQERAAFCMLKAGTDLHDAAVLVQKAIALQPKNADFKITLANVYLSAGLMLNAKRELEAAAQLSPGNGTIQALLKRVQKAG